jgi:predicted O-methyltransferase YrrM
MGNVVEISAATHTQAWVDLGRAERALVRGDLEPALAAALSSRVGGLVAEPDSLVSRIRSRVEDELPAFPTDEIGAAMEPVQGWFTAAEAGLLARAAAVAAGTPDPLVEVGSYCGRSTVVLALVVATVTPGSSYRRLMAIDPHQDYEPAGGRDTFAELGATLRRNGVENVVDIVRARSLDVGLPDRVALVFLDGLHDEESVRADVAHVTPHIPVGGLLAFHDYRFDYPGVVAAANSILRSEEFDIVGFVESLLVLRRVA